MRDEKQDKPLGRPVERTRATFSQTELAAHEAWAHFTLESPPAAALVHMLCRLAGDDDTVVASQRVLAERLGVSQMTISRAAQKAHAAQFIEIIRLGATASGACAYRLNSRVHWTKDSNGKETSKFRAVVLASAEDQPAIESTPLRRVPVITVGEIPLPSGPGLPPPSQPSLKGLEPVMYRDPVTGALFDLDPSTGELQRQLPIEQPHAEEAPSIAPESPPAEHPPRPLVKRIAGLLAASPDGITDRERVFLVEMAERLADGQPITAKQEAWAVAIVDREGGA